MVLRVVAPETVLTRQEWEHTQSWSVKQPSNKKAKNHFYVSTLSSIVILQKPSRRLQDSAWYASISLHQSVKNLVKSWRRSHNHRGFLWIETTIASKTPQLLLDFPVIESLDYDSKVESLLCHRVQVKSERRGFSAFCDTIRLFIPYQIGGL